jgi:hypothetical protein
MALELLSFCTSCFTMAFTFPLLRLCLPSFINQPQPQPQQQQQQQQQQHHHTNLTPLKVRPSSFSVKSAASALASATRLARHFGTSTSKGWQPSRTGNPSTHRHWGISGIWGSQVSHFLFPHSHFHRRGSHRSPSSIHGRGWYMLRTSTAPSVRGISCQWCLRYSQEANIWASGAFR